MAQSEEEDDFNLFISFNTDALLTFAVKFARNSATPNGR